MILHRFDVNPTPAPRMNRSDLGFRSKLNHRDKKKRQRAYLIKRYMEFKDILGWIVKQKKIELPHRIDFIHFYIPVPPSWSKKKKKQMDRKPMKSKPDWDNLAKSFIDAFPGGDHKVWSVKVEKFWTTNNKGWINMYIMEEAERKAMSDLINSFEITLGFDARYSENPEVLAQVEID